jgi:P4 family phage/plasmid primase-like protien
VITIADTLNDRCNGQRFARDHHERARWLIDEQEWRIWDDTHWRAYKTDERAMELAKATVATIYQEAAESDSDEDRKKIGAWARTSQNTARLQAMIKMAKSERDLWASVDDFDRDPYLLNFTNATVDLRTGGWKQHDPRDMISCVVPYAYNPYAQAPLWQRLIYRCTQCGETGGTAEFLKRALGYMLMGSNPQQKFFLFVGPKRTGKSKALEISARALGSDYAAVSQPKLITRSRWNTHHDSETWSIRGKRLVAISETDAGMDLDEAIVKNLTGASVIAMRGLHRAKEIQAPVTWTLMVGTNEEPNVEKWDDAIGRRIVKIPSGPSLDPSEVDFDLESKIINGEVEGVLAWLVAGAVEWHRMRIAYGDGLWMPPAVAKATSDFENDNDHVAEFVKACIDFGESSSVRLADVNRAYQQYRGKGPDALKSRALYSRIIDYCQANGYPVTKDHRMFYGLELAAQKWGAGNV